jgi:hypothetical protein
MNDKTKEPTPLTALHKDGEVCYLDGEKADAAMKDGWIDGVANAAKEAKKPAAKKAAAKKDAE